MPIRKYVCVCISQKATKIKLSTISKVVQDMPLEFHLCDLF